MFLCKWRRIPLWMQFYENLIKHELQRPSVSSVCCNIFEDYGTSYMNPERISQIQAKKFTKNCNLLYVVHYNLYRPLRLSCLALPCLYHFANTLRLAKPSIFWLFPSSRRLPFKEIIAFWYNLLFPTFLSPYMKSRLQKIMEGQVEMSHVKVLTQWQKNRFFLQCPAPTLLSR